MNYVKTFFLLVVLAALLMAIGYFLGGETGILIALILAILINFGTWFFSDKIVLKMYRAQEVDESSAPNLYRMVRDLAQNANIPMPKVHIIPSDSPNAFATGRDPAHASVAITKGALDLLTFEELSGVMAHELAHIKNRDSLVMVIAATICAAIMFISRFALWFGRGRDNPLGLIGILLMVILAPLVALLIQMAISRTREYGADKGGAAFSGRPEALASALEKISGVSRIRPQTDLADTSTAHLWIASPLSAKGIAGLFSTHPPVQERVKRLRKMSTEGV